MVGYYDLFASYGRYVIACFVKITSHVSLRYVALYQFVLFAIIICLSVVLLCHTTIAFLQYRMYSVIVTALHAFHLYHAMLYCIVLYCIVLYCIVLYSIVLYCIGLSSFL